MTEREKLEGMLLNILLLGGVAGILSGLLIIYLGLSFPHPLVSAILTVFGAIFTGVSIGITFHIRAYAKRKRKSTPVKMKTLVVVLALIAVLAVVADIVAAMTQPGVRECIEMWRRVRYVQYVTLGFLFMSLMLSLAPIILGRTILGPILSDLQYLAGSLLVLIIFALLLLYPIDVVFYVDHTQTDCRIIIENLRDRGAPLMRILLRLLWPPEPYFFYFLPVGGGASSLVALLFSYAGYNIKHPVLAFAAITLGSMIAGASLLYSIRWGEREQNKQS